MNTQLRKLQMTQVEILDVIDKLCREYGIPYSLYAGTLLGAARHKGFIPWDDDLDICMSRGAYERFIAVWNKESPTGYILQNKENSPDFPQSFTKIRKDHTTFLQSENEIGKYHTGIFVDVFPIDRIPNNRFLKLYFFWNCMRYQLYTRGFVPPKSSYIVRLVSKILLIIVPLKYRMRVREKLLKKITAYNCDESLATVGIETVNSMKKVFSSTMLSSYTTLSFEGKDYMCFKEWDQHLRVKFNDYMQFPPEDERVWKHHPILIDFEYNYEELITKTE